VLIRVLGSAAGGGFPQWNCGCPNCRGVRTGSITATARRQECVAVSASGRSWFLLNASPEIREQIESFPSLHPQSSRHSPIHAVVLTNGDLDHTLGLLSLRESHPLVVYATPRVRAGFTEDNVLYRTLQRFPGHVTWRPLALGTEVEMAGVDGRDEGLRIEAVPVPGKLPIHLEGRGLEGPGGAPHPEDNVGLRLREVSTGRRLAYFPAAGGLTPMVDKALADADAVFFDGTFWSADELPAQGLGAKRASDMAHLPVGGQDGSLRALRGLRAPRRIYIHVNNTNPLLREDSAERRQARDAGWEIAWDGMEVTL
jgi:pyrroloquinoline quinone biosynthesis protein B